MRRGCCGGYTPALSIFKKGLVSTSPVSISGPQFIQSGPTKQLMPLQTDTSNTVGSGYFSCLDWVIVWPSHSYSAPIISPHKSSFPISQLSFCCSFPQLPVSCKKHWTGLRWFVPWAPAEALWFFFFLPCIKDGCCFRIAQSSAATQEQWLDLFLEFQSRVSWCSVFNLFTLILVSKESSNFWKPEYFCREGGSWGWYQHPLWLVVFLALLIQRRGDLRMTDTA